MRKHAIHAVGLALLCAGIVPFPLLAQIGGRTQAGPPLQPLPHPELPDPPVVGPQTAWWVFVVACVVVVLILAVVAWFLLRPLPTAAEPPARPWQKAMDRLREIRGLTGVLAHADVAGQVSETLRAYFMDRYKIPAPFRTSQEIFVRGEIPQASVRMRRFAPLAEIWDLLAFAPVPSTQAEAEGLVDNAIRSLEEDRP